MREIKFKRLHPGAKLPCAAKAGDAGWDMTAIDDGTENREHNYTEYRTGVAVEIPMWFVGLIFPRSSVSNQHMFLSNSVGVIDSGYRGEITFRFRSFGPKKYKAGDRIGQLLIIPFPVMIPEWSDSLSSTERGEGGYGSSGN